MLLNCMRGVKYALYFNAHLLIKHYQLLIKITLIEVELKITRVYN